MIQRIAVATCLAALGASAEAQEFNTEALKRMQEQALEIAEEVEGKQYRTRGDLCLDTLDDGLVVKACSDAASQKWWLNEEGRLVADSELCVAGANLRECGEGNAQTWTYDESKRLANANQRCLQVQGDTPESGAKVVTAPCSDAAGQIWE